MQVVATSLKLPKALKDRISRLAKRAGESPHAYMLRMLESEVEAAERFAQFLQDARLADRRMLERGEGFDAAAVGGYLEAMIAGRKAARPRAARWGK